MDASFAARTRRLLGRFAVVGVVTLGAPLALSGAADAAPKGHWDRLAKCESGGRWNIATGNGYYGGLQFSKATWKAYGGKGMPHKASRSEQIKIAERVLAKQGWRAWPACSRKLGMRR
jgi:hypothetical protein